MIWLTIFVGPDNQLINTFLGRENFDGLILGQSGFDHFRIISATYALALCTSPADRGLDTDARGAIKTSGAQGRHILGLKSHEVSFAISIPVAYSIPNIIIPIIIARVSGKNWIKR